MFKDAQNFVHGSGCTLVLPGLLLLASTALLAYRQMTEERTDQPLNGFLANILLQMLPLVALKAKIWSCNDRVSLVPLVLVRTLLMHVILGIMRVVSQVIVGLEKSNKMSVTVDFVLTVSAIAILHYAFEFPLTFKSLYDQRDVRNLVLLATGAAILSEGFFVFAPPSWMSEASRQSAADQLEASKVFFVASNYVDIVAFMPVVWRLYQADDEFEDCSAGVVVSLEAKKQIQLFFCFVLAFYSWDDVIDPIMGGLDEPLAMMAHAAHFMLLLDFAGFFIFQVGNSNASTTTNKGIGEQLQGLLSEGNMEDDV
mmetsp:Transcript_3934/g.7991  ORF Transcript_3934/g.7991 Transcript_3934/m.7991 type:complete len:312 (-) Transcript_3934:64-999(-)|eukprot:CAMPEP_0172680060 /NCGR_PEP_ID=MMETSP1074-20121228/16504_1 /TAXON_ID=2916 /ORGANISM="Ceratium fusus, Strain PA161109" /LENGTH=311 /DNA_ID=CAMNT_0013498325 /DNA_START=47 /DNA_END=978 /DNA_ORIENTATION=-